MDSPHQFDRRRTAPTIPAAAHPTGHDLIAVSEWPPTAAAPDSDVELTPGREYRSRYWRCRACGRERNRRAEFDAPCPGHRPPRAVVDGGYSIEDERTRRALSSELTVQFLAFGPGYAVVDADRGERYIVDIRADSCSCGEPDERDPYCEHLRRVDLAVRTGELPGPDGRYVR